MLIIIFFLINYFFFKKLFIYTHIYLSVITSLLFVYNYLSYINIFWILLIFIYWNITYKFSTVNLIIIFLSRNLICNLKFIKFIY